MRHPNAYTSLRVVLNASSPISRSPESFLGGVRSSGDMNRALPPNVVVVAVIAAIVSISRARPKSASRASPDSVD